MAAVTIRIKSDDVPSVLVSGVVVEVYNLSGVFLTQGTTGVNGEVGFTLADADYDLRFFKQGVSILPRQPQRITVDGSLSNTFEVTAHVRALPEGMDPLRCRVSGYIVGSDGEPIEGVRLSFQPKLDVVVKNNTIAPSQPLMVTTDKDGYLEFDLLRGLEYEAFFNALMTLGGQQPPRLDVVVPDLPAIELDDLLYPLPIDLSFSQASITISRAAGNNDDVEADLQFSDGSVRTKFTPWAAVELQVSDDAVLKASLLGGKLVLNPLLPGVATVTSIRKIISTALFDPEPPYTTDTITVTVTA